MTLPKRWLSEYEPDPPLVPFRLRKVRNGRETRKLPRAFVLRHYLDRRYLCWPPALMRAEPTWTNVRFEALRVSYRIGVRLIAARGGHGLTGQRIYTLEECPKRERRKYPPVSDAQGEVMVQLVEAREARAAAYRLQQQAEAAVREARYYREKAEEASVAAPALTRGRRKINLEE